MQIIKTDHLDNMDPLDHLDNHKHLNHLEHVDHLENMDNLSHLSTSYIDVSCFVAANFEILLLWNFFVCIDQT